jgi:hypothetical protein
MPRRSQVEQTRLKQTVQNELLVAVLPRTRQPVQRNPVDERLEAAYYQAQLNTGLLDSHGRPLIQPCNRSNDDSDN